MKTIHYLTLAAILIALPAFAEDRPQPHSPPSDPETMLMQIDLKVTLQHYEKLRTEAGEAELQLALGEAGTPDPAIKEARMALAEMKEREKSQRVSKEELDEAEKNYKIAEAWAEEKLKRRYQVLTDMAARARAEARKLATELAKRTKDAALIHPQPQPKSSAPQS